MQRVLLTGAGGFVGRHCIEPLAARGFEVHAVTHNVPPEDLGAAARWHTADLLNPDQVKSLVQEVAPTHLLHLAWNTEPGKYLTLSDNLRWLQAGLELYLAFATNGGRRTVGVGTCIEYDLQDGQCTEAKTKIAPTTLYGACKHALHLTTEAFASETGLSAAWGRVFFLYGPFEHPARLVSSVIRSVLAGETIDVTHGRQLRDFLHVQDVASALVALLDSDVEGAVNIASGEAITLKNVIDEIGERTGRRDLIRVGARPASIEEPPAIYAEVSRLRDEVGWTPKYDLRRGIEETVNWWRDRIAAGTTGVTLSA